MDKLSVEQVEEWRIALRNGYTMLAYKTHGTLIGDGFKLALPQLDALCDLALQALQQNAAPPAMTASPTPQEPKWVQHMRIATLDTIIPHESEYLAYVDALRTAFDESQRRVRELESRERAAREDVATLAAIKKALHCDYDVVEISLAETEWERGYEACHRVVERTIRDAARKEGA